MLRYSISQRNKSRGIKTWYGRIFDDSSGDVRYQSLGTDKKKEAQDWLAQMNATRFLPEAPKQLDVSINDAVHAYLKNVEISKGPKSLTLAVYSTQGKSLMEWCARNHIATVMGFTPISANKFAATWADQAPITRRTKILNIRTFFKWVIETYELTKQNPFKNVKPPKVAIQERKFWTPDQINAILEKATNQYHRVFWALMAFAGLRRSEAISVKPVDIANGQLKVIGKGNKFASIPVSNRLRSELDRLGSVPQDQPFVSVYVKDYRFLRRACIAAGLQADDASFHRFRHSFASNLLRAGASIKEVQSLMRHENVQLTLTTYAHLLPNDLTKAVNLLK